jgi:hypothetical protein
MQQLIRVLAGVGLSFACLAAHSQQFPEEASKPTAAEVKKYLDDRVFKIKLADGNSWRLEYKSNGYFYVNTSTGFNGSGQWQAEDGKLCGQLKGRDRGCNEVRIYQELLHLKRDSGEVIQYTQQ